MNTSDVIRQLQLQAHPEGGYYRETYRSRTQVKNHGRIRNVCTAIYYLLENDDKSHFHRIQSDEIWHFHLGEPLELVQIEGGQLVVTILGNQLENGEIPQAVVPANTWFAARVKDGSGFSLVSCTVAPGFDFADFELAKRKPLIREFHHLKEAIELFTDSSD
ncbi:MAG: cupin domain-containing protein [Prolixibacteraceae bacterium]